MCYKGFLLSNSLLDMLLKNGIERPMVTMRTILGFCLLMHYACYENSP